MVKGVGLMVAEMAAEVAMPRYLCWLPPLFDGTVAALALIWCRRFERDSQSGVPLILGRVFGKLSMKDSGGGTEEAMVGLAGEGNSCCV
jgi:hypothetical protein